MVTVGSIGLIGALLWPQIDSATLWPLSVKRRTEASQALRLAGKTEEAEVIEEAIREETAQLARPSKFVARVEDAIWETLLDIPGTSIPHEQSDDFGPDLHPDLRIRTGADKVVGIEVVQLTGTPSAKADVLGRLEAAANLPRTVADAYAFMVWSPRPEVAKQVRGFSSMWLELVKRGRPNVMLGLIHAEVPDVSQIQAELRDWINQVDAEQTGP
jgi:hypothetical protein